MTYDIKFQIIHCNLKICISSKIAVNDIKTTWKRHINDILIA